ncbi:MAG: hypothetical protein L3I99_01960 [Sulfurimonas sp.]|nr:hypothetical protein [Sulfurimonas sp.]
MNNPRDEELHLVELGRALTALRECKNFDLVINQSYILNTLVDESINTLDINPARRQQTIEKIQAVSYLKRHLITIENMAACALEDIGIGKNNEL